MLVETAQQLILTIREPVTILGLRAEYPDLFYPQDWYLDEPFAATPAVPGTYTFSKKTRQFHGVLHSNTAIPAVVAVCLYVNHHHYSDYNEDSHIWGHEYVFCGDMDATGDQIYVGGCCMGRSHGFQIHRHLSLRAHHRVAQFDFQLE